MRTRICDMVGCEVPIFAFSHCRDVVVEVTKAGGFGVLGAATFSPEQLQAELRWIDEHVGGRPYGIDVIIPSTYDTEAEREAGDLDKLIPAEHRAFMDKLLEDEGVPPLPPEECERVLKDIVEGRGSMTPEGARRLVRVGLEHPQVKMVVSALGAPHRDVADELKKRGVVLGALCGKASHAVRQRQAGVEVVIAQGTEAGGHTGDISTLVLVPQVVRVCGDAPVLAAGGITRGSQIAAALALGAQGVWCGTIWLGTRESESRSLRERGLVRNESRECRAPPCAHGQDGADDQKQAFGGLGKTRCSAVPPYPAARRSLQPGACPRRPRATQGPVFVPCRAVRRRREQRDHGARGHVPPAGGIRGSDGAFDGSAER